MLLERIDNVEKLTKNDIIQMSMGLEDRIEKSEGMIKFIVENKHLDESLADNLEFWHQQIKECREAIIKVNRL